MPAVIPELVFVVGLFFAVVGYLTARGLLATWTHSLGYLLMWLSNELTFAIRLPFKTVHLDLGGPFRAVDHFVITALQNWCDGAEIMIGYCLHGMEKVARFTAQMVDELARGTDKTFDWLLGVHLPKWAKWAVRAAFPVAYLSKLIASQIAGALHRVRGEVRVIEHTITHTIVRTVVKVGAIAIPGAHALPGIRKEIHGLTRRNLRLAKRLHRVEGLLGVAAMAAAMANVLGLPNWRCLTRGNVGKTARHLCGLPTHLLDDLLGVLADVWILENVCVLLPFLEEGASRIGTPLVEALTVAGAGICKGTTAPGALRGPSARLPAPVQSLSLSLV